MEVQKSRREPQAWLFRIKPFVLANAQPGSAIQRAFQALDEGGEREGGPTWGARHMAAEAWMAADCREQARLLSGWKPRTASPDIESELAWMRETDLEPVLRVVCGKFGQVNFDPDFVPDNGMLAPMELIIRQGWDRPTVIAGLRTMLAAIDDHFECAIGLDRASDADHLTIEPKAGGASIEPVEEALDAVAKALAGVQAAMRGNTLAHVTQAALGSRGKFPVGTFVDDPGCQDSGVVIASYKGPRSTLMVYINGKGEPCSQYEDGLKAVAGIGGGDAASAVPPKRKPHTVSTQAPKLGGKGRGKKAAAAR